MEDFEKLGVFYLGREYDFTKKTLKDDLLLYDSKDLVTHAVSVGMTGSGKTGLCIGLLEEAALDGIPSILVDPKGDLSNLMLTFPDLKASDFLPWVNADDARKKGLSLDEYAQSQADLWKKGLGEWGQDGERIRKLREAADVIIYTPGSTAGISVSILKSFAAPEKAILEDTDLLRERVNTTVTSLLNLLGIDADPVQSREHILLSTILTTSWQQGVSLDLAGFISAIQSPSFTKVGVFDLESFFPSKDRFSLAMKMNNLLAAPAFHSWIEGEPLDIDRMFFSERGKPRLSIFSIAHLSDAERMFFVSLLLTQLLGWMRTQSGTTSLRALFYMDEIFGYFPPVANPPSKAPLMTLLKQARAFGLGIVLATQNPVDLDYKGLSNTGTWFIGRLQTERDKERVLDGLAGVQSSAGGRFDRQRMEEILAGLGKRVFLMNNVNEDEPVLFQTRWVLSYLRGPLTREQIKILMEPRKSARPEPAQPSPTAVPENSVAQAKSVSSSVSRPVLPPGIPEYFFPIRAGQPGEADLLYEPQLLGMGKVYYANAKIGITAEKGVALLAEFPERSSGIQWEGAEEVRFGEHDFATFPDNDGVFGELPSQAGQQKNYSQWGKSLRDWLYRNHHIKLMKSELLSMVSAPDEPERDFRIRLQQAAREKRDLLVERIREKYAAKISSLEERVRRAEQAVEREKEQAKQQKLQTAISFGATVFSALLGRKRVSRSSLGRAATTARGAGRIMKESRDIDLAEENVEELQKKLKDLQNDFLQETEEAKTGIDPMTEQLAEHIIKPKKKDISVSLVALAWVPYWKNRRGGLDPAW